MQYWIQIYISDTYIEEEGRPQSQITASLYGDMFVGMMTQPATQWANRSSHGQLPSVSFLSVENLYKNLLFIRVMYTSTLQLSKCHTPYPSSHPGSWHHDQHQQTQASWMDSPCTILTWWPYQRGSPWLHRTLSLHHRHIRNEICKLLR